MINKYFKMIKKSFLSARQNVKILNNRTSKYMTQTQAEPKGEIVYNNA